MSHIQSYYCIIQIKLKLYLNLVTFVTFNIKKIFFTILNFLQTLKVLNFIAFYTLNRIKLSINFVLDYTF